MPANEWKYLKVEKLFHTFDYILNFPTSSDPLIMTGPNGYGKTTLLETINALVHEDYLYFWTLPFKSILLGFGTYEISINRDLDIESKEVKSDGSLTERLTVTFSYRNTASENNQPVNALILDRTLMGNLAKLLDGFDSDNLVVEGNNLKTKANEIIRKTPELAEYQILLRQMKVVFVPAERLRQLTLSKSEMDSIRSMTYSLQIAISRLERSTRNNNNLDDLLGLSDGQERTPVEETILKLSRKLKETMGEARQSYSRLVETNNKRLIERMLSNDHKSISYEEYISKTEMLRSRYSLLQRFDLIDELQFIDFVESNAPHLKTYLDIVEENLRSYDSLTSRLQIFLDWIERNQFRGKTISASMQSGLIAIEDTTKSYIPLTRLSSGEKHEIILAYWLAFEVPDGSLLLIDEPELSLHVAWQIKFIPELRAIAERKQLISIVATHAPFIINEQWDKTVDLELLDRSSQNIDD